MDEILKDTADKKILRLRNFNNSIIDLEIPKPCRGFGGLQAIPQGVTVEKCDEKEHFGTPEGRSPYGQDRHSLRSCTILSFFIFNMVTLLCFFIPYSYGKDSLDISHTDWKRKGSFLFRVYQDTVEDNQYENKEAIDAKFKLDNKVVLKDLDMLLEINAEGRYEFLVRDDTDNDIDIYLREAYCQWQKENFRFSVGRQIVTWGKLDDMTILDRISPQEYNRFILYGKQDRKLPAFMLKYDYFWDNYQLESIFLPIFKPADVAYFDSDWSVYSYIKKGIEEGGEYEESTKSVIRRIKIEEKDRLTENNFGNNQFGLRLRGRLKDIDYGLYYMNIYNNTPALREKTAKGNTLKKFLNAPTTGNLTELVNSSPTDEDLTLEREHPRLNIFGLDAETVLGKYGIRTEWGLFLGQPYLRRDYSYVRKDTLSGGIGADHTTANDFYYNLQLIENIILNYEDLFAQEEIDHRLTAKASKDFLRGNLQFNFDSSYSLSYHDWMLNPELTYKFKNGFDTSFGGFIFEGSLASVFGKYSTKDLIYLEMVYKF